MRGTFGLQPSTGDVTTTRRTVLTVGSTTALTTFVGCTRLVDFVSIFRIGDVNVFNDTDQPVRGTIEITRQEGTIVFQERFALEPAEPSQRREEGPELVYRDVFLDEGGYTVSIELDGARNTAETETAIDVDDLDDDYVVVVFAPAATQSPINVFVTQEVAAVVDPPDDP